MRHERMARNKFFLDNLCSAIESAVQNNCGDCGEDDEHDALRANILILTSIALRVGLTFCWAKRVTWQGIRALTNQQSPLRMMLRNPSACMPLRNQQIKSDIWRAASPP